MLKALSGLRESSSVLAVVLASKVGTGTLDSPVLYPRSRQTYLTFPLDF